MFHLLPSSLPSKTNANKIGAASLKTNEGKMASSGKTVGHFSENKGSGTWCGWSSPHLSSARPKTDTPTIHIPAPFFLLHASLLTGQHTLLASLHIFQKRAHSTLTKLWTWTGGGGGGREREGGRADGRDLLTPWVHIPYHSECHIGIGLVEGGFAGTVACMHACVYVIDEVLLHRDWFKLQQLGASRRRIQIIFYFRYEKEFKKVPIPEKPDSPC